MDNDISKKIIDLISRHRVKRFTGQVTIVLNYSQGGVGTVEVVVKEVLK